MCPKKPTIDHLIGSRIIIGFQGKTKEDPHVQKILQYAKEGKIAGVILFGYNIESPEQLKALVAEIKSANPKMLIAVDQEGGLVRRLRPPLVDETPAPLDVAKQYCPKESYDVYLKMAKALKEYGVNLNFAPVVDVHSETAPVIGKLKRAFSDNPKVVVQYAKEFIRAHADAGIRTVIKHYPGHGLASVDTHRDITDITKTHQKYEYHPYKALRDNANSMVMTAHLVDQKIDRHFPASLSKKHHEYLKNCIGYKGIIVSDDLHMGAIQKHYGVPTAAVKAIGAGSHLIILGNNPKAAPDFPFEPDIDLPAKVNAWVKEAIRKGELSEKDLTKSYEEFVKFRG